MKYRSFGGTGWQASVLGLRAMRLPTLGRVGRIDEKAATALLRNAVDHGINYIDAAWDYHCGTCEELLGRALGDGYRSRVKIATKQPVWLVREASDFDRFLNAQLQRLRADHVDLYLLDSLNDAMWEKVRGLGVLEWARKARRDGRIGWIGFAFNDEYPVFRRILDAWDGWDFCHVTHNYLDCDMQAGARGVRDAADRGLAVVAADPLQGGGLAAPPPPVRRVFDQADTQRSAVEWALQWAWNKPEVSVALCSMGSPDQLAQNAAHAERSGIGSLSAGDLDVIGRAAAEYEALGIMRCTKCHWCVPCPRNVSIPINVALYNKLLMGAPRDELAREYAQQEEGRSAAACSGCGECAPRCPKGIPIPDIMQRVTRSFQT